MKEKQKKFEEKSNNVESKTLGKIEFCVKNEIH